MVSTWHSLNWTEAEALEIGKVNAPCNVLIDTAKGQFTLDTLPSKYQVVKYQFRGDWGSGAFLSVARQLDGRKI